MHRLILVVIIFYVAGYSCYGQKKTEKIQFTRSFTKAKKLANEQKKLIFVDVATSWCGPCKKMEREVFTDPNVVKLFNETFVNLKVNGDSSNNFKKKYGVRSYPTLLFIDLSGNEVYKTVGGRDKVKFLELGEKVKKIAPYYSTDFLNKVLNAKDDEIEAYILDAYNNGGEQPAKILTKKFLEQRKTLEGKLANRLFLFCLPITDDDMVNRFVADNPLDVLTKPAVKEKLALYYLKGNFNSRGIKGAINALSKIGIKSDKKLMAYLYAYANLKDQRFLITPREKLMSFAVSLLTHYPETSDIQLLYDAASVLIYQTKFSQNVVATCNAFEKYVEANTVNHRHYDILSLLQYKCGMENKTLKT